MKKGMKALKRVAAVDLTFTLADCGASGTSSQSTAGRRQDAEMEATGGDANIAGLPTLRVAMMPFITGLPTEYIRKNKLDKKAGFKVDTIMFATRAPMNEILAADLWDIGVMGTAAVTGVANYDTMIIGEVLGSTDGLGAFVKPNSPTAQARGYNPSYPNVLGDPETVEGATILLPIGAAQHFATLKWLGKLGLGITDVNIVNMDTIQAYQVLQTNQYDAIALSVPTFFGAVDGDVIQVGNLVDLGTRYVDMIVASGKAMRGKQGLVQKYIDCVKEAYKALNDDPDVVADLVVNFLRDTGTEAGRESCVSDLGRAHFITAEDWKDHEVGNFARELGEFYISLGQLEPELTDKFNDDIVSNFVKNENQPGRTGR